MHITSTASADRARYGSGWQPRITEEENIADWQVPRRGDSETEIAPSSIGFCEMESSEVAITQLTIIARRLLEQFKGELGEHRADDSVDNQRLLDFILDAFYDVGRIAVALDAASKKAIDDAMIQRAGNCSVCGRPYHTHLDGLFCRGSTWTEP